MILIVDDKKENLLSLQSLLAVHGFPVHTAENGEEALKKVLKNNYALIILDVQMPVMDGFEVAEHISGYSKTNDIPIIFLSAVNTDKKFITKGYSSGAIDYITKPIDPDIFLLKVNTFYKLYEQKRALNDMQLSLQNEIEFRKKAQQDTQEKAKQLVSILESIPQLAFTTGPDGVIEYINSEWERYTDGGPFPSTLPGAPTLSELILKMAAGNEPVEYELQLKIPQRDEYRHFLLRAVPIKPNEQVVKWVGTLTDIEDQKLVIRKKDEFLGVVSHELKTPLTSLKGYMQLLQKTVKSGDVTSLYVDRTLLQVQKIEILIADLLDSSKIENGRLKLNMHQFNFGTMLANTIDMIRHTYPDYEFEQDGITDVLINGDENRLEQVIVNFIANAIKYSPASKKVIIHNKLLPGHLVQLRIQDFGIGIAKEDQRFIFDKFYRTESANQFHGLGLGLYISADILKQHNADYGVESEPGKGSTFYFSIPYLNEPIYN